MKKKIQHDYGCKECGKIATRSIQDLWHVYTISNEGNFDETDTWESNDNDFYCEQCFKKEFC